jgi:hypothetical protein
LRGAFRSNRYDERQIVRALNPPTRAPPPCEDYTSVAFLPFVDITFNYMSKVLSKLNIKMVGLPPRKLSSFLGPIKDHLALKTPGVYSIPCECRTVYVRQTGCSVETRVKEHSCHIGLEYPEKSTIAEHSINLDHWIQVHNTCILANKLRYIDQIIREAVQTILYSRFLY